MARRAALILFAFAAIFGVAVAQGDVVATGAADPERWHGNKHGGGYSPNGRVSRFNPSSGHYSPVSLGHSGVSSRPAGKFVRKKHDTVVPATAPRIAA